MPAKIVRLTDTLSVASQIDAEDIPKIAALGFRTIVNNRPDDEEPSQLPYIDARRIAEEIGVAYYYQPVTTATLTKTEIDAFGILISRLHGNVLAHCRSGTRCYLLWAATQLGQPGVTAEGLIQQAAERGFDISALARFA